MHMPAAVCVMLVCLVAPKLPSWAWRQSCVYGFSWKNGQISCSAGLDMSCYLTCAIARAPATSLACVQLCPLSFFLCAADSSNNMPCTSHVCNKHAHSKFKMPETRPWIMLATMQSLKVMSAADVIASSIHNQFKHVSSSPLILIMPWQELIAARARVVRNALVLPDDGRYTR